MHYYFIGRILERYLFFFFNDTATTEIYTLSLHDALPISARQSPVAGAPLRKLLDCVRECDSHGHYSRRDRKSTRLNSSHLVISYAVFCLKKKKQKDNYDINQDLGAHPSPLDRRCLPPLPC